MVRSITTDPNVERILRLWRVVHGARYSALLAKTPRRPVGGGVTLTYPASPNCLARNCRVTTPQRHDHHDVPLSNVNEPGAIDNRLHEVTASTMTLQQPANTCLPSLALALAVQPD